MKKSIKQVAAKSLKADEKLRETARKTKSLDSIQNFAAALGIGTANVSSAATYGFNPITRTRTILEWIHRGSWLGGVAVDVVADDMTREGVEITGDLQPDQIAKIQETVTAFAIWNSVNDVIKWSRLYGGSLGVFLIEGQDFKTPLRIETIGKDQFKGMLVLDRWMVEPSLSDLVTEMGPMMGMPKYYTVNTDGPALFGQKIHYSRCLRLEGIRLPYWQRVMENLWGISVIERLWDRMVAFDSATQGAAQLVYKSYLRTYKMKDLRETISAGGPALDGLVKYVNFMRQTQSIEGITLLDAEDEFEAHTHGAFSGLSDAILQFGQQLSGALQIPLVRLFGQSPAGLNSTGESDLRTYYDGILQQQSRHLLLPVTNIYRATAQSLGIKLPEGFGVKFKPLWQLSEEEKSTIAANTTETIMKGQGAGLVSDQVALRELKQSSHVTGVWSNITDEEINAASDVPTPPVTELLPGEEGGGEEDDEGGEKEGKDKSGENKSKKKKKPETKDADKISQEAANYVAVSEKATHCGICANFESGNCKVVEGKVVAAGGCDLFKASDIA